MPDTLSIKERIKGARRQRRSHRINLRGDMVVEIERLEAKLEKHQQSQQNRVAAGAARLGGQSLDTAESERIAAQIQTLREEMDDQWIEFVFEARPYADWKDFANAHPPKDDDESDKVAGLDWDVLVSEYMPTCVVEPELDAEDWGNLFSNCSPADLRDMAGTVYAIHQRSTDVPFSRAASAVLRLRAADSELPEPGASVSDGSTDGSQPSSTSTSTTTTDD